MTERTVEPQDIAPEQEVVDLFADTNPTQEEDLSQYDLEGALTLNEKGELIPLTIEKEEEEEVVEEAKEPEWEMPEKYRDKGLQDIIDMHRNAEKRMGQLQNELNEYKKLSEGIVKRELNPQPAPETAQSTIDVDSLLDNPEAAIGQLIAKNPALKQLQEQIQVQQLAAKQAQFIEKYPNALETAQSEHFQEWVNASPVRQRLFSQADQNYDLELAGELMDMYHGLHATAKAAAKAKQDDAYKTVAGVSSTPGKPASDGKGTRKKWYKQSQVLKIMEDPTAYQNALANGLEEAMMEGRIHYHL